MDPMDDQIVRVLSGLVSFKVNRGNTVGRHLAVAQSGDLSQIARKRADRETGNDTGRHRAPPCFPPERYVTPA
jgi:hypothetical protein